MSPFPEFRAAGDLRPYIAFLSIGYLFSGAFASIACLSLLSGRERVNQSALYGCSAAFSLACLIIVNVSANSRDHLGDLTLMFVGACTLCALLATKIMRWNRRFLRRWLGRNWIEVLDVAYLFMLSMVAYQYMRKISFEISSQTEEALLFILAGTLVIRLSKAFYKIGRIPMFPRRRGSANQPSDTSKTLESEG